MKIEKIATQPVVVLNPADTLNRAIQQMWRLNIEHLPVVQNGQPVGMVSERDLLSHACGDNYAAHELTHKHLKHVLGTSRVDDIMSSPVVSLSPDDSIENAAHLMLSEEIDAVPLTARDSIVGIVTQTDILKCYLDNQSFLLLEQLSKESVVDFMHAHVFSVRSDDLKPTVIRLMRDKRIRHVPVLNGEGVLVGVIAESDVILGQRLDRSAGRLSVNILAAVNHSRVADIMNAPVVLDVSSSLRDAAREMVTHRIGCVPIMKDKELVGILTNTDLVRAFVHAVA